MDWDNSFRTSKARITVQRCLQPSLDESSPGGVTRPLPAEEGPPLVWQLRVFCQGTSKHLGRSVPHSWREHGGHISTILGTQVCSSPGCKALQSQTRALGLSSQDRGQRVAPIPRRRGVPGLGGWIQALQQSTNKTPGQACDDADPDRREPTRGPLNAGGWPGAWALLPSLLHQRHSKESLETPRSPARLSGPHTHTHTPSLGCVAKWKRERRLLMYWVKSRASLVLEVGVWMGTWWGTSQPHQLEGDWGGRRNTVGVEKYTTDNTLHIQDVSHFSKFCVCVCVWSQFVNSAPFMFIFKKKSSVNKCDKSL